MPSTQVPPPPEQFNFAQHLLALNAGRPDRTAFVDDDGLLGYSALDERVRRCAALWAHARVGTQQRRERGADGAVVTSDARQ